MTEMIEYRKKLATRHMIDPLAFFGALILAPVLVTLLTFWVLLIPVFALVMGGPVYLITAVPVLLWWLGRREPDAGEIMLLAMAVNLAASALIYLYFLARVPNDPVGAAVMYLAFGSIFAPAWAGMFAWLYRRMRRPFFTRTV